eukprot:GILJ01002125.1.p1 GENE.GILJ01002125.1~~GILJ01002125.1.p1  ORF type:complete len:508 (-),score=65.71 GILJ01002125.1:113-1636(-)
MQQAGHASTDVLVVGGGISGLVAAKTCQEAGLSVRVLEARERVGGRTYTVPIANHPFDIGGQWVGPLQEHICGLIDELGLRKFDQFVTGKKIVDFEKKISTYKSDIPSISIPNLIDLQLALTKLERLTKSIPCDRFIAEKAFERLDSMTMQTWVDQNIWLKGTKKMMDVAVRTIFGCEANELSLLHGLFYANASGGFEPLVTTTNGAQQWRVSGGTQQISIKLKELLEARGQSVVLNAPVTSIAHQEDGTVCVHSGQGVYSARFVVVAAPINLLDRITWQPALPLPRMRLQRKASMGWYTKVIVLYRTTFWREKGFSGEAISDDGPLISTFDDSSEDGAVAALVGFSCAAPLRNWAKKSAEDRKQAVLEQLARYFGQEALACEEYVESNWEREEFTGGAPIVAWAPGTLYSLGETLRRPWKRVHWATTETATEGCGFMDGAVQAGKRAAREVISRHHAMPVPSSGDTEEDLYEREDLHVRCNEFSVGMSKRHQNTEILAGKLIKKHR